MMFLEWTFSLDLDVTDKCYKWVSAFLLAFRESITKTTVVFESSLCLVTIS